MLYPENIQQETKRALSYLTQEKASANLAGEVMQKKMRGVETALQILAQVQGDLDQQAEVQENEAARRSAMLNKREETVLLAESRLEAATGKLEIRQADLERLEKSLAEREREVQDIQDVIRSQIAEAQNQQALAKQQMEDAERQMLSLKAERELLASEVDDVKEKTNERELQISAREAQAAELLRQATQQHALQQQQQQSQRQQWVEEAKSQLEKFDMLFRQISSLKQEKTEYDALLLVLRQQAQEAADSIAVSGTEAEAAEASVQTSRSMLLQIHNDCQEASRDLERLANEKEALRLQIEAQQSDIAFQQESMRSEHQDLMLLLQQERQEFVDMRNRQTAELQQKMTEDAELRNQKIEAHEKEITKRQKMDMEEIEAKKKEALSLFQSAKEKAGHVDEWAHEEKLKLIEMKETLERDQQRLSSLAVEIHEREAHVTALTSKLQFDLDMAQRAATNVAAERSDLLRREKNLKEREEQLKQWQDSRIDQGLLQLKNQEQSLTDWGRRLEMKQQELEYAETSMSARRQQMTRDLEKDRYELEASRRELETSSRAQLEREKRTSKDLSEREGILQSNEGKLRGLQATLESREKELDCRETALEERLQTASKERQEASRLHTDARRSKADTEVALEDAKELKAAAEARLSKIQEAEAKALASEQKLQALSASTEALAAVLEARESKIQQAETSLQAREREVQKATEYSAEQLRLAQKQLTEAAEKEAALKSLTDVSARTKCEAENLLKALSALETALALREARLKSLSTQAQSLAVQLKSGVQHILSRTKSRDIISSPAVTMDTANKSRMMRAGLGLPATPAADKLALVALRNTGGGVLLSNSPQHAQKSHSRAAVSGMKTVLNGTKSQQTKQQDCSGLIQRLTLLSTGMTQPGAKDSSLSGFMGVPQHALPADGCEGASYFNSHSLVVEDVEYDGEGEELALEAAFKEVGDIIKEAMSAAHRPSSASPTTTAQALQIHLDSSLPWEDGLSSGTVLASLLAVSTGVTSVQQEAVGIHPLLIKQVPSMILTALEQRRCFLVQRQSEITAASQALEIYNALAAKCWARLQNLRTLAAEHMKQVSAASVEVHEEKERLVSEQAALEDFAKLLMQERESLSLLSEELQCRHQEQEGQESALISAWAQLSTMREQLQQEMSNEQHEVKAAVMQRETNCSDAENRLAEEKATLVEGQKKLLTDQERLAQQLEELEQGLRLLDGMEEKKALFIQQEEDIQRALAELKKRGDELAIERKLLDSQNRQLKEERVRSEDELVTLRQKHEADVEQARDAMRKEDEALKSRLARDQAKLVSLAEAAEADRKAALEMTQAQEAKASELQRFKTDLDKQEVTLREAQEELVADVAAFQRQWERLRIARDRDKEYTLMEQKLGDFTATLEHALQDREALSQELAAEIKAKDKSDKEVEILTARVSDMQQALTVERTISEKVKEELTAEKANKSILSADVDIKRQALEERSRDLAAEALLLDRKSHDMMTQLQALDEQELLACKERERLLAEQDSMEQQHLAWSRAEADAKQRVQDLNEVETALKKLYSQLSAELQTWEVRADAKLESNQAMGEALLQRLEVGSKTMLESGENLLERCERQVSDGAIFHQRTTSERSELLMQLSAKEHELQLLQMEVRAVQSSVQGSLPRVQELEMQIQERDEALRKSDALRACQFKEAKEGAAALKKAEAEVAEARAEAERSAADLRESCLKERAATELVTEALERMRERGDADLAAANAQYTSDLSHVREQCRSQLEELKSVMEAQFTYRLDTAALELLDAKKSEKRLTSDLAAIKSELNHTQKRLRDVSKEVLEARQKMIDSFQSSHQSPTSSSRTKAMMARPPWISPSRRSPIPTATQLTSPSPSSAHRRQSKSTATTRLSSMIEVGTSDKDHLEAYDILALEKESQRLRLWEEDLKRQQSLLQMEHKELGEELASRQHQLDLDFAQLKEERRLLDTASEESLNLKKQAALEQEALKKLQDELNAQRIVAEETFASEQRMLVDQRAALEADKAAMRQAITELEVDKAAMRQAITELEVDKAAMRQAITELEVDKAAVRQAITELEENRIAFREAASLLEKESQEVMQQRRSRSEEAVELQELRERMEEDQARLAALADMLNRKEADISQNQKKMLVIQQELLLKAAAELERRHKDNDVMTSMKQQQHALQEGPVLHALQEGLVLHGLPASTEMTSQSAARNRMIMTSLPVELLSPPQGYQDHGLLGGSLEHHDAQGRETNALGTGPGGASALDQGYGHDEEEQLAFHSTSASSPSKVPIIITQNDTPEVFSRRRPITSVARTSETLTSQLVEPAGWEQRMRQRHTATDDASSKALPAVKGSLLESPHAVTRDALPTTLPSKPIMLQALHTDPISNRMQKLALTLPNRIVNGVSSAASVAGSATPSAEIMSPAVVRLQQSNFQHQADRGAERLQRLHRIVARLALSANAAPDTLQQVDECQRSLSCLSDELTAITGTAALYLAEDTSLSQGWTGQLLEVEVLQRLTAWEGRVSSAMQLINNLQALVPRHSISPAIHK
ncbi:hypothetical protein CEUSTIGMA_g5344.t1 [Chlamydomonas eustigma]|uniref:Uncharacterized protein n=1 Tax=Chlamydomonas eustigma TaxID=1157962 RepID=A0A250X4T5_9CHLO|nr:hypothetical protein CEUSTIGMA_g5344.t1 [Chlamydomonas eustigma]|eukprot:GAX77902.1 hypothetical protein CEUSTIGMA_g5344.t1 [Chlamydomonas eustigma]